MRRATFDIGRRSFLQSSAALGAAGFGALGFSGTPLFAQGRGDTLIVVQELGPNSLDMQGVGSNQTVNGLAWNCYDRLLSYAVKTLPDGTPSYDREKLAPELAESWQEASDGMSCTFRLRRDATFHDGTPVTAKDVKWSFDRAVTVGGFPTFQMSAGSLEKREQFVAVDDHTFRIDYIRKDKMLLFNVAVVVPFVINSELARKNATEQDPWALTWLRNNEAGGGAYRIEAWRPGSETVFARFDNWKSGPLPKIRRIIARDIPSAGTRRAMLERGDADFSTGFPPKDFDQLIKEGKVNVTGVPIPNGLWYVALNTSKPPFDNVKLRQAVAWAMPYEAIQSSAFFGRAVPMHGGPDKVEKAVWPQPFPYVTNLDKAKALMAEAGFAQGLETTLALDTGSATVGEPAAVLIAGEPRQDRHQGYDREGAGRQLAHHAQQERAADGAQPVFRLARLSGVLFLLELPRQQFDLQHLGLQESCNGRADRQGAVHHGCGRVRPDGQGVHRALHERGADGAAEPADPRRRDAKERVGLSVLVSPRAGLPAVRQGLKRPKPAAAPGLLTGLSQGLVALWRGIPAFLDFERGADHKARRFRGTWGMPFCPDRSTRCVELGECPEWQRGRTVNPLAYAFAGSSPASPTSLRALRALRLGKPSGAKAAAP